MIERLGLMKIPLLGLVVNRTGSEAEHSYYGYHNYGYGYEYGYGDGYGHEQSPTPENADREHAYRSAITSGTAPRRKKNLRADRAPTRGIEGIPGAIFRTIGRSTGGSISTCSRQ